MTDHARNLDTYNDSQADDDTPDVGELLAMIRELTDVAKWYRLFYHEVKATAPEYFERCGV